MYVTKEILIRNKNDYFDWLNKLYKQIKWIPTTVIKISAVNIEGYTQQEADAIPAAYPFLCEQIYKQLIDTLISEQRIIEINELLKSYDEAIIRCKPTTYSEKRTVLHTIFHEKNIEYLGLPQSTTTKDIATKVERGDIDIKKLCDIQLSEFFVKYYLGLK
jgi:hypothetical protein